MTIRHLDRLLEPRSVAVFGASDRPGRVGTLVWRNLRAGRFAGPVWAVNPTHSRLDGVAAFASVAALPEAPDLAVLCTPPPTIAPLIAELGARGTRAAIVMTAGLTAEHKQAALDAARVHCLRLLGPNCIGLMSPHIGLNATFAHTEAPAGEIAFVSQSGALVTAVLDWAASRRIGFSHLVSLGEHIDVDFGDLLDALASDGRTRAIVLYIESIGGATSNPGTVRKFMSAARAAARNKPVVVVKAGRAETGMRAAASHTGALAGSDIVFDAAIRRAGMLRVDTLGELFLAVQTLAHLGRRGRGPSSIADGMTIMTNGGGGGVMAADAAESAGVPLPPLPQALIAELDTVLPPNWSRANPIDLIGDAPVERYTNTLAALLARPETGTILFLHAPTAIVRSDDIARACVPLVRGAGTGAAASGPGAGRVLGCWLGDSAVARAREIFTEAGVPDHATPEEAVHAVALVRTWRRNQQTLLEAPAAHEAAPPDLGAARKLVAAAIADGRTLLDEAEGKALLAAYGVPVVPTRAVAADPAAAALAARELGFPAALKIRSRDIAHKSDVGGVVLGLRDEAELHAAAVAMLMRVRERRPEARIDGFSVQPMASRPGAHELIAGASIDSVFGPVLLFGQGGTAVEVVADRAIALPPLNRALAAELIARTRVSRLLAGYRDRPAAKHEAIEGVLVALAQLLADLPEVTELDINPLWADEHGVLALDARVRIAADATLGGAARFAIRPYPAELAQRVHWADSDIVVRPIRPEDEAQHRAFLEQLSPEDIRMRVFHARRELPRSELARLTQIDYEREMAFIAVGAPPQGAVPSQGQPNAQTLGVVRAITDPDNSEAEFAIVVRSDLKGHGLGRLLMARMIDYARSRGTERLVGDILAENTAMLGLVRALGFRAGAPGDDPGVVQVSLALQEKANGPAA